MVSRNSKTLVLVAWLALACGVTGALGTSSAGAQGMSLVDQPVAKYIGIPVKSVSWVHTPIALDGRGDPCALIVMGQQGDNFILLRVNLKTGDQRQFNAQIEQSNYPTAALMSRSGLLYIGASYSGHLYAFDAKKDRLTDLGGINPEPNDQEPGYRKAQFACGIDEDARGRIWIGSYGTADLTSYDPKTGQFTRHGRMDEVDMYCYPLVNVDGLVCCRILVTQPRLVVFDPATGEKRQVGPVTVKGQDTFDLYKDESGSVYIKSNLGNFRIEGFNAVPVDKAPEKPSRPTLHGVKSLRLVSGPDDISAGTKLEVVSESGGTKLMDLKVILAGIDIFYLHLGPDNLVYGSSVLPLHILRYNPAGAELVDLGSLPGGEAYSMGNLDGKIYILAYTGSTLSVYDPSKPYHYGNDPDSNPRDLGRMDDISFRPRSTLTGPLGRVWVASIPDYGTWGGPLSAYDPKTGAKKAYYRIAGDASCYTLAHLEEQKLIAVGTTVHAGTGTQPKVKQAVLFLFDYRKEKKVWEGTLDRPVDSINALVRASDGRLYGTVTGGAKPELFAFNPKTLAFEKRIALPEGEPLDLGLQNGPDGYVYGFTSSTLYRFLPGTMAIERIYSEQEAFSVPGPILGQDIYFASGPELRSIGLFK